MNAHPESVPEQRRFLVINFWIGSRDDGLLEGPVLVSTGDYERFHLWDEPYAALLNEDEYQIVKLYPRGLTYEEATRRFASEYPWAVNTALAVQPIAEAAWWLDVFRVPSPRLVVAA
jgi:hypothetical protein